MSRRGVASAALALTVGLCAAGACRSKEMPKRLAADAGAQPAAGSEAATRSIAQLGAQCDEGKLESCRALGVIHAEGTGVPADPARARALYEKACTGKLAKACNNLGLIYASGIGVAADPARAATLYRTACDGGDPLGCRNLGLMLVEGRGVPADPAAAAALFEKSCAAGSAF
ncbi:MAG TPA: tetratricopeptide repeat protein, partial [Kofleriaceae bacterium]|nr:tetratricopeptide repeat protein [Kofleriaceae bacterium]